MKHTDLYFKVRVEHEDDEKPERLGSEICRQITKVYGVESAELSHFTPVEE
jgi:hypothetical protein